VADENKSATETQASSGMGAGGKIAIVAILAAAVVGVVWIKNKGGSERQQQQSASPQPPVGNVPDKPPAAAVPKLVDLGAGKCIPCKMMAPILEELKKEYAGKLDVVFIDVWQNPDAGKQYGINLIPTQIFYGADGKELFRHEGFFSKEDILKKWKELGVDFTTAPAPASVAAELPKCTPV